MISRRLAKFFRTSQKCANYFKSKNDCKGFSKPELSFILDEYCSKQSIGSIHTNHRAESPGRQSVMFPRVFIEGEESIVTVPCAAMNYIKFAFKMDCGFRKPVLANCGTLFCTKFPELSGQVNLFYSTWSRKHFTDNPSGISGFSNKCQDAPPLDETDIGAFDGSTCQSMNLEKDLGKISDDQFLELLKDDMHLGNEVKTNKLNTKHSKQNKGSKLLGDFEAQGVFRMTHSSEGEGSEKREARKNHKFFEEKVAFDVESLAVAVIVGRPNVGKSALFNRLTHRKEAMVYNTPQGHVTRDHREGIGRIGDLRLRLLDTAGLEPEAGSETVLGRTGRITQNVLKRCHLALFLLDGRAGLQPQDEEVASWLRRSAPHVSVVLLVNKCEGLAGDASGLLMSTVGESHSLGLGDPIPMSAETGEGLWDVYERLQPLVDAVQEEKKKRKEQEEAAGIETAAVTEEGEEADGNIPLQLAICGRPNVGKSTLLNGILGEERALTGPEPGLTRDCVRDKIQYNGRTMWLVDTAGWIQRSELKGASVEALSAQDARNRLKRAQVVAMVLDASEIAESRRTLTRAEMALARWVVLEGRALVIVINKMDVLDAARQASLRRTLVQAVPQELSTALPQVGKVPILFTSAIKEDFRDDFLHMVEQSYYKWCTRLPTAALNKWLEKVAARTTRTAGHGSRVRYMTQVKARPPTFVAFSTGTKALPESDMKHLGTLLREDFGLEGVPVRVHQRHRPKNRSAKMK